MHPSQNAIKLTKAFEGLRLESYSDPSTGGAPWTIGYGRAHGVKPGERCTVEQAEAWLIEDLTAAAEGVRSLVKAPLTQGQLDALTDFVFNLGKDRLAHSTLLKLLNQRNYQGAAAQFPMWCMAGGVVLPGLVKRRAAERALFEKPA